MEMRRPDFSVIGDLQNFHFDLSYRDHRARSAQVPNMTGIFQNRYIGLPITRLSMATSENKISASEEISSRKEREPAFFCLICYRAFEMLSSLEEHIGSHKELSVKETSCAMRAVPAGVI